MSETSNEELTPQESGKKDGSARHWLNELKAAYERFERFLKEAKECNEAYIGCKEDGSEKASHQMAIYWSNLETMAPALYSQTPKPLVARRFKDSNPIARRASEILERNLVYYAQPEYLDPIATRDVSSYLRVGLAVDWVRYVSKVNENKVPLIRSEDDGRLLRDDGTEVNPSEIELLQDDDGGTYFNEAELEYEDLACDKVHYADFLWGHCHDWDECPWVARRIRLRKDAAEERFGKDIADKLTYSSEARDSDDEPEDDEQKTVYPQAQIWEIWSKEEKKVFWVSKGVPDLLDEKPDPLGLAGFFPCPKPLIASHTDDSIIPRADYIIYRKQIKYVDELTRRIHCLTEGLLLKGVYDASIPELASLLESSTEKEMIAIENFALFMEKGGLEQMVKFMPVEVIAKTLQVLIELRRQAIQDIYEITGMSDILRGASDPRETATAQRVKGQFAALRLRNRQKEVQRYLRDLIAIKAEIIAEHFDPETMLAIADMPLDDITIQAIELLKTDKLRAYRIDIETDSTIEADENIEKQAANEMLVAITGFLDKALLFSERAPAFAPVMGEMMGFMVRRYRAGRTLEETIEQASQQYQAQLAQMQANPPQPPPDPKVIAAQPQAQLKQAELAQKAQESQAELQLDRERIAGDQALKKYEIDLEHARKLSEAEDKRIAAMNPFTGL